MFLGTVIKSTVGIGVVIALLSAIDFGRQDVEKVKESVVSMLKNPQTINEQHLQETIKNTIHELQEQAQRQLKPAVKPEPPAQRKDEQKEKPTPEAFADLYYGGNWNVEEIYK